MPDFATRKLFIQKFSTAKKARSRAIYYPAQWASAHVFMKKENNEDRLRNYNNQTMLLYNSDLRSMTEQQYTCLLAHKIS